LQSKVKKVFGNFCLKRFEGEGAKSFLEDAVCDGEPSNAFPLNPTFNMTQFDAKAFMKAEFIHKIPKNHFQTKECNPAMIKELNPVTSTKAQAIIVNQ
jgi:hypothetical protein